MMETSKTNFVKQYEPGNQARVELSEWPHPGRGQWPLLRCGNERHSARRGDRVHAGSCRRADQHQA